jgi:hypothetical protein
VEPVVVVADEVVPVVDVVDGPVNRQETPNRLDKETHSHCVDKAFSALRRTTHCLKLHRLPILLTDSCCTVTLSKHCLLLADPLCPFPCSLLKRKQQQQQQQQQEQLKFPVHFSSNLTIPHQSPKKQHYACRHHLECPAKIAHFALKLDTYQT